MPYLVDGYNYLRRAKLLDAAADSSMRASARDDLCHRLSRLAKDGITVIWDAKEGPPIKGHRATIAGVRNEYARNETADDAILRRLRSAPDARDFIVVSDDNDIRKPAKQLGARVQSIAETEVLVSAEARSQAEDRQPFEPPAAGTIGHARDLEMFEDDASGDPNREV